MKQRELKRSRKRIRKKERGIDRQDSIIFNIKKTLITHENLLFLNDMI